MAETYCGKTCTECEKKEILNCPGCMEGPGRKWGGDCEIARCCANKGHEQCQTCGFAGGCAPLRGCHRMPEHRLKRIEDEALRQEAIAQRAPVLGKWLWLLFWLVIPSTLATFLTNDSLVGAIPGMRIPGLILSGATSIANGVILLILTSQEERYKTAGICTLICAIANLFLAVVSPGEEQAAWTLLISAPAAIVSLVSAYYEFNAHCTVLTGVNNLLADKWVKLWKWNIGSLGAMLGSVLLIIIAPILGILVMVVAGIAVIVVSILRLVYLYQTANAFRIWKKPEM